MSKAAMKRRVEALEGIKTTQSDDGRQEVLDELSLAALKELVEAYEKYWPVPHSPTLGDATPPASDWEGYAEPPGFQDRLWAIIKAHAPDPETFERWKQLLGS